MSRRPGPDPGLKRGLGFAAIPALTIWAVIGLIVYLVVTH